MVLIPPANRMVQPVVFAGGGTVEGLLTDSSFAFGNGVLLNFRSDKWEIRAR